MRNQGPVRNMPEDKAEAREESVGGTVAENDIVYVEYDLWVGNDLYDSTDKEKSEEHHIYEESAVYEALPVIVDPKKSAKPTGADHFKGHVPPIEGLVTDMIGADLGKDRTVEIPPEKAFGERDTKLVEMKSKREIMRAPEFKKGETYPAVGMTVTFGDRTGWISMVTAGRVRVDFNNRLAGKALKYDYRVVKRAESLEDKALAIIDIHYGSSFGFRVEDEEGTLKITLPEICRLDQNWFSCKVRVVADLRKLLDTPNVVFIEEYLTKDKKDDGKEEGESGPVPEELPPGEEGESEPEEEAAGEGSEGTAQTPEDAGEGAEETEEPGE